MLTDSRRFDGTLATYSRTFCPRSLIGAAQTSAIPSQLPQDSHDSRQTVDEPNDFSSIEQTTTPSRIKNVGNDLARAIRTTIWQMSSDRWIDESSRSLPAMFGDRDNLPRTETVQTPHTGGVASKFNQTAPFGDRT